MRFATILLLAASMAACAHVAPVSSGDFDRDWYLSESIYSRSTPAPMQAETATLPTRIVIQRSEAPGPPQQAREMRMTVSSKDAKEAADLLATIHQGVIHLRDLTQVRDVSRSRRWADLTAAALVTTEELMRFLERQPTSPQDSSGRYVAMILRALSRVLGEGVDEQLLVGLDQRQRQNLRLALVHGVLRLAFAAVDRQEDQRLDDEVAAVLARSVRPAEVRSQLRAMMERHLASARPSAQGAALPLLIERLFRFTPPALKLAEDFLRQWDKVQFVQIELRQFQGERIAVLTFAAVGGQTVTLTAPGPVKAQLVLRGCVRLIMVPSLAPTNETVLAIQESGGELRLEYGGVLFGLFRLLAIPIENAALKEVRVSLGNADTDRPSTSVQVLTEVSGRGDGRRLTVFHNVLWQRVHREAFRTSVTAGRKERTLTYVTPRKRYWLTFATVGE